MTSNIYNLSQYREAKERENTKSQLYYIEKVDLLDELIRYYEAIKKDPCNIELALWGEDLMEVISDRALTRELSNLVDEHQQNRPKWV
jgi:hypothetical protein